MSISDVVDKIFIFWDDTPWGNITECEYKRKTVKFPKKFDNIIDKINELDNSKVELIYDHMFNNIGQFTHFVNNIILPNYEKPSEIMIVEVDHVFRKDQLRKSLEEFKQNDYICASTRQIEMWKYLNYKISERQRRGVMFWNMKKIKKLPQTRRQGDTKDMKWLSTYVHNCGFAVSEKVMYWKHLTAIGFSKKIGDSLPNENWLENKWLRWHHTKNNKNLEISKGKESSIPFAVEYDTAELPEMLKIQELEKRIEFWDDESNYIYPEETETSEQQQYFKNKDVLEIGPGKGRQFKRLEHISKRYSIADISRKILDDKLYENVENKYLIDNYFMTLGKKFDVIHLWFVIHHLTNTEVYSIVNFLFNHLKEDGVILFNYPDIEIEKKFLADVDTMGTKTTLFDERFVEKAFEDKFKLTTRKNGCHIDVVAVKNRKWLS
jgi:2-polyprenyl-3-methyl-5-hydroxy-6-metoxy-1,4-benzoquinol methylase